MGSNRVKNGVIHRGFNLGAGGAADVCSSNGYQCFQVPGGQI